MASPSDLVHNTGNFVHEHPLAAAGIGLGVVLVVWYLVASNSGASASSGQPASGTSDAAQVAAAQIAANQSTANAQIAAGVADNQTAAAQTIALAQATSQQNQVASAAAALIQQASFNETTAVTQSNNAVQIAGIQANEAQNLALDARAAQDSAQYFLTGLSRFPGTPLPSSYSGMFGTIGGWATPAAQAPAASSPVPAASSGSAASSVAGANSSRDFYAGMIAAMAPHSSQAYQQQWLHNMGF